MHFADTSRHSKLTHNVHGPHDDKFYAFLKVLNDDYDALRASGYSGPSNGGLRFLACPVSS